jgi:hypothetical protein
MDEASMDEASMDEASMDGTSMDEASMDGTSMDGTSMDEASMDGTSMDGTSRGPSIELRYIELPRNADFPSTIEIRPNETRSIEIRPNDIEIRSIEVQYKAPYIRIWSINYFFLSCQIV